MFSGVGRKALHHTRREPGAKAPKLRPRRLTELERLFGPDVLAAFDERARRISEQVAGSRDEETTPATADAFDEATLQAIRDQALIANKTYLTRAEAAKYLGVRRAYHNRPAEAQAGRIRLAVN